MRKLMLWTAMVILVPAALAMQVDYDLGEQDGAFGVRVAMEFGTAVPARIVVGSLHPDTEMSDFHGTVQGTETHFPVHSDGNGMAAELGRLVRTEEGAMAVQFGGLYFDESCLQNRGVSLLFERRTNFPTIRIHLPAGYGLLYCNLPGQADYVEDHVVLTIQNPEREQVEIKLVARLLWEEPLQVAP